MIEEPKDKENSASDEPDFYLDDNGLVVFTRTYHLKRGYCCESGCRHCPFGFSMQADRE